MTQRTENRTSPAGTTVRMGGILAVLLSGQFMANVDTAIVNVATPSIQETIGASGAQLELVVSGYVLAYAVLLMTGARLGDLFGYRRLFLMGLAVFTLASLACGLALNPGMLVAARVIQGIGAALMVPQVLIGIHQSLPSSRRPRALGYYALTLAGSGVAGQVLGGALVTANLFGTAWRPIFLINLPVGLILIIVAARVLPADERHRRRTLDLAGTATLSAALLLVVVPLVLGRELSWPLWTWLCFAACVPTFIVFVLVERHLDRHGKNPLLNLSVVTRPTVAWGLIANVAAGSGYFALLFVLAQYLQQALGKSPLFSGLALVPCVAAFGIAAPPLARLLAKVTSLVTAIGYLLLAVSLAALSAILIDRPQAGVLLFALLGCAGLGLGIGFTSLLSHLTGVVPSRHFADISGLINTTSQLAGALGVAVFGTMYFGLLIHPDPDSASTAMAAVTAAIAATAAVAALAAYRSTRKATAETVR